MPEKIQRYNRFGLWQSTAELICYTYYVSSPPVYWTVNLFLKGQGQGRRLKIKISYK
jgi:hypothetical protein